MSEHDPAALHRALAERGHALIRVPGLREQAQSDPWAAARRLWGEDAADTPGLRTKAIPPCAGPHDLTRHLVAL